MSSRNRIDNSSTRRARVARSAAVIGLGLTLALAPLAGCAAPQLEQDTQEAAATSETTTTEESADSSQDTSAQDSTQSAASGDFAGLDTTDFFSDRDLAGTYDAATAVTITLADSGAKADAAGVSIDGSTVTITQEGTYLVTGSLSDGRLVVDADETAKVQIVLADASISSSTGTALCVRSADKVFLTPAEGTSNTIAASGATTTEDDHNLDAAVWSHETLTINGTGALAVTSAQGHGVVSKDNLKLCGSTLTVDAAKSALQGKDSVRAASGTYTLKAGTDGVHVEADAVEEGETPVDGYIYLAGGTFDITAASDGFDASYVLQVDDATISVDADDDGLHAEYDLLINGGSIDVTRCYEGIEGARITVNGGDVKVVADDDGLNATGDPTGEGDESEDFAFGDRQPMQDGFGHGGPMGQDGQGQVPQDGQGTQGGQGQAPQDQQTADGQTTTDDAAGSADATSGSTEGAEAPASGEEATQQDGTSTDETTTDDASTRTDRPQGMMGGAGGGGGGFGNDETAQLTINGGTLVIDAAGDGVDSNGDLLVTGGTVYVSGPTNGGNGSLDYGDGATATITGGTFIAAGSSGMAENFSVAENQGAIMVDLDASTTGEIQLKDASGTVLASFTPTKEYQNVVVSAAGILQGETYTLVCGDATTEVTMDSLVYGAGNAMGGGGFGGGSHEAPQGGFSGPSDRQDGQTQDGQMQEDSASVTG